MRDPQITWSPEDEAILRRHVTDLTGNIYCIRNLPEEVVAVMFAYVSRSPRSFRENLLRLVKSEQIDLGAWIEAYDDDALPLEAAQAKARDFHERVTLGYGHSSVSELSSARVGIERVSRIASAELELANPFLSFIEYSQRYQRPQRGDVYVPPQLSDHPDLQKLYLDTCDRLYDAYEELNRGLVAYLQERISRRTDESEAAYLKRIEKIAFEDARYALPLATLTNLGMVGNARAVRDAIVRLLASPYPECVEMAQGIREQVLRVLPTLLRHAEPSAYLAGATEAVERIVFAHRSAGAEAAAAGSDRPGELPAVELLRYTGMGTAAPEAEALRELLAMALYHGAGQGAPLPEGWVEEASYDELLSAFRMIRAGLGPHDNPLDAFTSVKYRFRLIISEANWHQMLRHSRKIRFGWTHPRRDLGFVVPPHIEEAGLTPLLEAAVTAAEEAALRLEAIAPRLADYLVTNAHRRAVVADLDLWELYHLINLRTTPEAQWDIRKTVEAMEREVAAVHPNLVAGARRR